MGQVLYRKYRSKSLDEVVGQNHIVSTLKNALKQGKLGHAILLSGPRGVGKTSVARIIAHSLNDLEYNEDKSHLDIIEIDAASNRRIDEIRDLREKAQISPASAKFKVYIIDEVHMLTREAFNALLKTLEEPPKHVVFILATTEAHKLPETIISRTQRFVFKPIALGDLKKHLQSIAKKEDISISPEALELVAEHGDGSFRDAISLLDQLRNIGTTIEAEAVLDLVGVAPAKTINEIIDALASGSPKNVITMTDKLRYSGIGADKLAVQIGNELRNLLVQDEPLFGQDGTLRLLNRLQDIASSEQPYTMLEIVLLESLVQPNQLSSIQPEASRPVPSTNPASSSAEPKSKHAKPMSKSDDQTADKGDVWQQVVSEIKKRHNALYGVVRLASVDHRGDTLTVKLPFAFHAKRIQQANTKQLIEKIFTEISGQHASIICEVESNVTPEATKAAEKTPKISVTPDSITNIFGATEVLES